MKRVPSPLLLASLLALVVLLELASPRSARGIEMVNPRLKWQTITTPHFVITFHDGEEALARKTADRAELIHHVLTRELEWTPSRRTQLVLVDRQDDPNGYATPIPYNTIVLYPTAPEPSSALDHYEDWLTILITHEYTHILHMDTIGGLPRALRWLMGSLISPNALQPRWILEGFATLQETRQTLGGRGTSTYTDMVIRTAALEGRFPSLDQAEGYGSLWPGGNIAYLFGVSFQQWVANRYGEHGWTAFSRRNARTPVPFLFNWHAREVFGKTLYRLWHEWQIDATRRARAVAAERSAAGLTPVEMLTDGTTNLTAVRYAPDGARILIAESPADRPTAVVSLDARTLERKVLATNYTPRSFSFSGDGRTVYFSSEATLELYDRFDDIYAYDLTAGQLRRVTRGKRARDPELSPDGSMLLFVANKLGQTNLAYTQIDGQYVSLTDHHDFTQYATPRFAPDGRTFVASVWTDGGYRDLYQFSRDGRQLARLTTDRHQDQDPTFSPDGRYLLFSCDRDGIHNLYAMDLTSRALYRVTNVLGGAFQPSVSPDGRSLIFLGYTANGFNLFRMAYDPSSWTLVAPGAVSSAPQPAPAAPPLSWDAVNATPRPIDASSLPAAPYNPLPTLPPRFVAPLGYLTESSALIGLYTFGGDVLSKHNYYASLTWRTDDRFLGYGLSYTNQQLKLPLEAGLSAFSVSYGALARASQLTSPSDAFYDLDRGGYTYYEVRTRASVGIDIPFSRASTAFLGYRYECREPLTPIPGDVSGGSYDGNPFSCAVPLTRAPPGYRPEGIPARGRFAGLSLNYRYSRADRYRRSISPERGGFFDVTWQVHSKQLGGDYDRTTLTVDGRAYLSAPDRAPAFFRSHVLAVRGAGGIALGNSLAQPSFRLGGSFGENPAILFPDEYYPLRGFPVGSSSGEAFALGNVEYRFPLWRVDRGLGTWPVFLRALSGAAFADVGEAVELPTLETIRTEKLWQSWLEGVKLGIGGELRADVVISYGLPLVLRGGLGAGLTDGGYRPDDLYAWYFQIGSYF